MHHSLTFIHKLSPISLTLRRAAWPPPIARTYATAKGSPLGSATYPVEHSVQHAQRASVGASARAAAAIANCSVKYVNLNRHTAPTIAIHALTPSTARLRAAHLSARARGMILRHQHLRVTQHHNKHPQIPQED